MNVDSQVVQVSGVLKHVFRQVRQCVPSQITESNIEKLCRGEVYRHRNCRLHVHHEGSSVERVALDTRNVISAEISTICRGKVKLKVYAKCDIEQNSIFYLLFSLN